MFFSKLLTHFKPFVSTSKLQPTHFDELSVYIESTKTMKFKQSFAKYDSVLNSPSELLKNNWSKGTITFSKDEVYDLSCLSSCKSISKLVKQQFRYDRHLRLESAGIFLPSEVTPVYDSQYDLTMLYHYYHVDSTKAFKVLIVLHDSIFENELFSYIAYDNSTFLDLSILYLTTGFFRCLFRFLHYLIRILTFGRFGFDMQPPMLRRRLQHQSKYTSVASPKAGTMILFNNLYPHSSHTGPYTYKSPILQLVFKS